MCKDFRKNLKEDEKNQKSCGSVWADIQNDGTIKDVPDDDGKLTVGSVDEAGVLHEEGEITGWLEIDKDGNATEHEFDGTEKN